MKRLLVAATIQLLLLFTAETTPAQTDPTGLPSGFSSQYALPTVSANDFTVPLGIAFNSDGTKMFVWEKRGKVFVCNWNNGTSQYVKQTTPVLDISDEVGDWKDMGFTGFTLDPNFDVNGLIYCLYVVDQHYLLNFGTGSYNPGANAYFDATIGRITRYQTSTSGGDLTANPGSRKVLLGEQDGGSLNTGPAILYDSHGVGTLHFGSDGTLLASFGDGASYNGTDAGGTFDPNYPSNNNGSYAPVGLSLGIIRPAEDVGAFRSQMINSYSGKIVRIDPETGDGIPSNPFYDPSDPHSAKSKVWAMGLRNPFRFSVKPNTGSTLPTSGDPGALLISDVGWASYEEVDICDKGGQNFGWPIYEGVNKMFNYYDLCNSGTVCIYNQEEPNPLGNSCSPDEPYFKFRDLVKDPKPDGSRIVYNPCNPSEPIGNSDDPDPLDLAANRYIGKRPIMDWHHGTDNETRIPTFNPDGSLGWVDLGDPASPVAGVGFNGFASIGGTYYTGDQYPPDYVNSFFMVDYSQKVKSLRFILDNTLNEVKSFAEAPITAFCLEQNPKDGLVYYVSYLDPDPNGTIGRIRKFVYGGNLPPVAKFVITNNGGKNYGPSPLTINFDASSSFDPDGSIKRYRWQFGDGSPDQISTNDPTAQHTYTSASPVGYTFILTITDNDNVATKINGVISVNNTPPTVQITSPQNGSKYPTGQKTFYDLTANVSDNESNNGLLTYAWQPIFHHNTHEHPSSPMYDVSPTSAVDGEGCGGETFYYAFKLTVTDPQGLSTTVESDIFPDCVALPVTLISFSGSEKYHLVNLNWKTTNETLIHMYEVERSSDGVHFEKIGEVGPKGGSVTSVINYSFVDQHPLQGKAYYRLRIVHVTGSADYSLVINFTLGSVPSKGLKVYPTPFKNNIVVETYFEKPGEAQIQLIDVQGRILRSRKQFVEEGTRNLTVEGLDNILPGTYYLNIIQNGENRKTKVMKMN